MSHVGNYTLCHEFDDEIDEKKSVSASPSIKSIKSACDEDAMMRTRSATKKLKLVVVNNYAFCKQQHRTSLHFTKKFRKM